MIEQAQPSVIANRILQILQAADWCAGSAGVQIAGPGFVERRFGVNRMIAETFELYGMPSG